MSFSLLDLDAQQITKDKSKITMMNNLLKDVVILKPDNGNGIVLVDINDCRTSVKHLFSDKSKFRIVENDPTFTRLDSLQQYVRKLKTRNEISEEVRKRICPKNARLASAHGAPKIHKDFVHLPKFRPIIDIAGSTYYHVRQYLSEIFQPFTTNDYNIKDSFDAANRIKNIPKKLFDEGHRFVSLCRVPIHKCSPTEIYNCHIKENIL